MEFTAYPPAADLARLVRSYWMLSGVATGAVERILPDGRPEMIVHLAGEFEQVPGGRQPGALFAGQMQRVASVRPLGFVSVFGVSFQPFGARTFFPFPQQEASGAIHDLEAVGQGWVRCWAEEIRNRPTPQARVATTDRYLRGRVSEMPDPRVAFVCSKLREDPALRVEALAGRVGLSRRSLERAFRKGVGLSPKGFAQVARFQRALALRRQAPQRTWTQIAAEAGYYDQAHLVADCRAIAGLPPTVRETERTSWEDLFLRD